MPQFADRVKISSSTTGTGTLTLASAVSGFQSIPASLDGETVGFVIENGSSWELSQGTYTHSGTTLSRTYRSSSTGALLNLSGTSTIFLTPAAADLQTVHVYSAASDLPSASANHGKICHVHSLGRMVFAHGGNWINLANASEIVTYVHPNHTGEVTSAADGATVIADNVVDEANLKVSNSPTNGYVLTAQSGNTGGLTWAAASSGGGGGSATSALSEQEFTATANQTVFTVSGGITNAANVAVFLNGSKLGASDYTASASSNNVTLAAGATVGDLVEISEFGQEAGGASVTSSDTAPSSPSAGDLWFDSSTGELLVWYVDGSSNQWVGVSGTAGPQGAAGSSVTSYSNLAGFPSSGNTHGDMAYAQDTKVSYMWLDTSWQRMSIGPQIGPRLTTTPASTHSLSIDGSTSTITIAAVDESGFPITYDWDAVQGSTVYNAASLPTALTSVAENNGVFTLTPSTNTSHATTTLKFRAKASDGVLFTPAITTIYLDFTQDLEVASGGGVATTYSSGGTNYRVLRFTSSGVLTVNSTTSVDYLIVGAGGSGGNDYGGGGGAGGLVYQASQSLSAANYAVVVGVGGAAIAHYNHSNDGTNSTFNGFTANGGGGGGSEGIAAQNGRLGGSGGGAGYANGLAGQSNQNSYSGTGFGNRGGTGVLAPNYNPAGGGGSGGIGLNGTASVSGNGGAGKAYDITGTSLFYAAGGGGGFTENGNGQAGIGGSSIGGNGAVDVSSNAAAGAANTGSGGGGASGNQSSRLSGAGANGVVIIRYVV